MAQSWDVRSFLARFLTATRFFLVVVRFADSGVVYKVVGSGPARKVWQMDRKICLEATNHFQRPLARHTGQAFFRSHLLGASE